MSIVPLSLKKNDVGIVSLNILEMFVEAAINFIVEQEDSNSQPDRHIVSMQFQC